MSVTAVSARVPGIGSVLHYRRCRYVNTVTGRRNSTAVRRMVREQLVSDVDNDEHCARPIQRLQLACVRVSERKQERL